MDNTLKVALATQVTIDLIARSGEKERLRVEIVVDEAADFEQGLLGITTPLAKRILGQRAGASLPYQQGDLQQVKIIKVEWSQRNEEALAAEKRRAVIENAVNAAEQTTQEIFASTFTSKWGGYDAGKLTN